MKTTVPVLFLIALLSLILIFRIDFLSDDAFISFRYAENFSSGKGLVYNEGEKVEGYTNFLWVMMLSVLSESGFGLLQSSRAISIACAVSLIIMTYLLSSRVFGLKGPVRFLSSYLVALNPGFVLWAYSGMETLFFSAFILAGLTGVLVYCGNGRARLLYFSSAMFLIAGLTRPEGVLFFSSSFLFLLMFNRQDSSETISVRFRKLAVPVLVFVVPFAIYLFWKYNYYGQLMPNTYYAKTGFEDQQVKGLYYCFKFVRESMAGGFLLIFPVYILAKTIYDVRIRFMFFIVAVYCIYLIFIGGDNLLVQRFFVPVIAFIFTLTAIGFSEMMSRLNAGALLKLLFAFFFILYPLSVISDTRAFPMLGVESTMLHYENIKKAGLWLKENSSRGETVAVESAGIIPYYSELKSYDRLGLNDPHISRSGKYGEGERDKSDEEYVKWTLRPDYIVDAFPTLEKMNKPDMARDSVVYRYNSVLIGKGALELRTGVKEYGDLYFNFYKKANR